MNNGTKQAANPVCERSWVGFVLAFALFGAACGGSSAESVDSSGSASINIQSDTPDSGTEPANPDTAAGSAGDCGPGDVDAEIRAYAQSLYQEGVELKGELTSQCVGASPCTLQSLSTVLTFEIRFLILPDGSWLSERELDEEQRTGEALQKCFWDQGLEPTADEAALVTASLWSTLLSLNPSGFPEEGLSALTDSARELPVDFDNYAGPRIEEIDGVETLVFIAADKVANWYVVQTVLDGEVVTDVSTVYVG